MSFVKTQIIYSRLASICREMGQNLTRLSRSPVISEDRSFASGMLDHQMRLTVQEQGEPSHLFALRESVRMLMDYFAFDIVEGDILIVSDPSFGGTYGNVMTIALPLFKDGENIFTIAVRLPLSDLGGDQPGPIQPNAVDIWAESLRVTPLKLYRGGALQKDLYATLAVNSRAPDLLMGDLQAGISVCKKAEGQILEVLSRYGAEAVFSAIGDTYSYTQSRVAKRLKQFAGRKASASMEFRPPGQDRIIVCVSLDIGDDVASFDLSGSSPARENAYNVAAQATKAAASLPLLMGLLDELSINEGLLNSFHFSLPDASVVNPKHSAATSLSQLSTIHVIAAAVTCALRRCGAKAADFPCVHGVGPYAVIYQPVGTVEVNKPRHLEPGIQWSSNSWGAPALRGVKQLASAEELEVSGGLRLEWREFTEAGDVVARVRNLDADLEGAFVAIDCSLKEQKPSHIKIIGQSEVTVEGMTCVSKLAKGDLMEFCFPKVMEVNDEH